MKQFTSGWTGAEIEQCVISAMTRARLADRESTEKDLINIAANIVPLSRTMKEQINHIRGGRLSAPSAHRPLLPDAKQSRSNPAIGFCR